MNISSGRVPRAQKIVVYGPEGIGKSTFASHCPAPLFIDTEGSSLCLDVRRFDRPSSWTMLMQQIDYVLRTPGICKTLVIDTADWAESLCKTEVCESNHVHGIEDFGYGKGYTYLAEAFGKLLNKLEDVINAGINVCITAHASLRKIEQPEEAGAYDHWELKLSKQCAPLLKEWSDLLLFANYKVTVVKTADGTKKGTGGKRVMYATHQPAWDAKNRHGLPDEMPFDFASIEKIIPAAASKEAPVPVPVPPQQQEQEPLQNVDTTTKPTQELDAPAAQAEIELGPTYGINVPKPVADLLKSARVSADDVQRVVAEKGYYPLATPISKYDPSFISGWIVPFWDKIVEMIRNKNELPF